MKKNIFFIIVVLFCVSGIMAQKQTKSEVWKNSNSVFANNSKSFNYTLTTTTNTYTNLTGATSLNNGMVWDDPSYTVQLPFNIIINNNSINEFEIAGVGGAIIGFTSQPDIFEVLMPFETDLIDRGYDDGTSLSPISYVIEGVTGSRIFKMEWQNAGSYSEGDPYNMYVNFQIWLYEGTNVIEYHYGPNMIDDPDTFYDYETGAWISVCSWDDNSGAFNNMHFLTGLATAPTLSSAEAYISGTPANGTVYCFTPVATKMANNSENNEIQIFPNPASDYIKINNCQHLSTLTIKDVTGSVLKTMSISQNNSTIDIKSLPKGHYFVSVSNASGLLTKAFIKY